jgi:hypothetical protein
VTGSFPVHEDGATSTFGFGGCWDAGSFVGVDVPLCFAPRLDFGGGGSGSIGLAGLRGFGVFFAI